MIKIKIKFVILPLLIAISSSNAQAVNINVAASDIALNPGNSSCSLIEAIKNAEADSDISSGDCPAGSGADTIILANSIYSLTAPYTQSEIGTYDNDSGLPGIRSTITINANGATIQRDPSLFTTTACNLSGSKFRIFFNTGEGNLTLNNLTLKNGCSSSAGGAIFNHGILDIDDSIISNNEAASSGGAIHNNGNLSLTRVTISNNSTSVGSGGGIVNRGTLQVVQSTINNNDSVGAGGGLDSVTTSSIANTTVSGNQSSGDGGGIYAASSNIINSTIASNTVPATATGSGIFRPYGTVTLSNTLVANPVNVTNCNTGLSSSGSNIADDSSCPATQVADALIGALADNGGTTLTHKLLTGSPAINAGNITTCNNSPINGIDQRGISRGATSCDSGAYQSGQPSATSSISGIAQVGMTLTGSYIYADAESDPEDTSGTGSSYRFIRSTDTSAATTGDNTDVSTGTTSGSNKMYTILTGDVGKYFFYCVTPKATTGATPGDESCSIASAAAFVTVPDAPTIGAGIAGNTTAQISFSAPANNGGSAITSYTASCGAGTPATGASSPLVVTGLSNDTPYNCSVLATNAVNNSLASGIVVVTPTDGGNVTIPPKTGSGGSGETVTFTYTSTSPSTIRIVPTVATPPAPTDPTAASSLTGVIDINSTSPGNNGYSIVTTFNIDPGSSSVFEGYWKYGVETGGAAHWYDYKTVTVNGDGTGYEISNNGKTLKVYLTDGIRGDDDLAANGTISDPGLPIVRAAIITNPIPTLSFTGLLVLSGLLGLFAFSRQRKLML
jgi:IPTL-CTERM motif